MEEAPDLLSGNVEILQISRLDRIEIDDFESIGSLFGLLVWLGVTDLHRENFRWGFDHNSKFLFAPIDVESIFEEVVLPSQTLLVSETLGDQYACALDSFLTEYYTIINETGLGSEVSAFAFGYATMLKLLNANKEVIQNSILENSNSYQVPIRVIPRSTQQYVDILRNYSNEQPLFECERSQLARSDIPYYFRFLNENHIYYYSRPHIKSISSIVNDQFGVKYLGFKRAAGSIFNSTDFSDTTLKAGLLQIVQCFAKRFSEHTGHQRYRDLKIGFLKDKISVESSWGKFRCQRHF